MIKTVSIKSAWGIAFFLSFSQLMSCAKKSPSPFGTQSTISSSSNDLALIKNYDVAINFSGKGSAVIWDIGVVKGFYSSIKPIQEQRSIFMGNSSGSILASYFSCFGLTEETLTNVTDLFNKLDRTKIPENYPLKAIKLMAGTRTEISVSYLKQFIEQGLNADNGGCTPKYPLIIPAANGDILENRTLSPKGKGPYIKPFQSHKFIKTGTLEVFEGPNQEGQPLPESKYLGKACTYFVDQKMHQALSVVGPDRLQCDLRLITTFRELVFAITSSVAEPTYYYPTADLDPNVDDVYLNGVFLDAATDPFWLKRTPLDKQIVSDIQKRPEGLKSLPPVRYYVGGFLMSSPAQDLRRVLPETRILSTGRPPLGLGANDLLSAFYLVDTNLQYQMNRWWIDLEVQPNAEEYDLMNDYNTPSEMLIESARLAAFTCVMNDERNSCAPAEFIDEEDSRHSFKIIPPLPEFILTHDGRSVGSSGRQLPLEMTIEL